jgi:phage tail-like protein
MPGLTDQSRIGLVNRFRIVINGDYDLGSWSKVTGLDVTWDPAEYRAGDMGNHRWFFPGNTKYTDVTLERAACEESKRVKDWLSKDSFGWKPGQTGTIILCDSSGEKIMDWELKNIMVRKWSITGFDAGASQVAKESLIIAHLGFLDDEKKMAG